MFDVHLFPLPAYHPGVPPDIDLWLRPFALDERLHVHAAEVFASLPAHVREDLMGDPAFSMCDYEPGPGVVFHVPVRFPAPKRGPARSVVLKRTLRSRHDNFVRWVIAHELAHAHLRNAGRWPGEDPERAADALAEDWGFPRPPHGWGRA
jgi:hypothetical protein